MEYGTEDFGNACGCKSEDLLSKLEVFHVVSSTQELSNMINTAFQCPEDVPSVFQSDDVPQVSVSKMTKNFLSLNPKSLQVWMMFHVVCCASMQTSSSFRLQQCLTAAFVSRNYARVENG